MPYCEGGCRGLVDKWLEYFVWEKNSWKIINFWLGICEPRPGVYIPYVKEISKILLLF